jgi:magnesium-protoporphyrin O-methyltransferase
MAVDGAAGVYAERRAWLTEYFDRTAAEQWARLTSDAPVSRVRQTVRAGRDRMRATLLGWLPADLSGARVLDAGCGTGAAALELARRGALVTAVDLSPTLVGLAEQRAAADPASARITFRSGDMLDAALGRFDYAVAMDSLIHYPAAEIRGALAQLAARVDGAVLFTVAPRTPLLAAARAVGRLFPRADRAPAIEPIAIEAVRRAVLDAPALAGWRVARDARIKSGFYTSHALELVRDGARGGRTQGDGR